MVSRENEQQNKEISQNAFRMILGDVRKPNADIEIYDHQDKVSEINPAEANE